MSTELDPRAVDRLEAAGQGHLVQHARTLEPATAARFVQEAAAQPWGELRTALARQGPGRPPVLRPPHGLTLGRRQGEGGLGRRLAEAGGTLLAAGRVATLLLAGGQGSRLGFDGPKGNFPLGPDPDRTLFAIQAERVVASGRRAGRPVPLVVLVSRATEAETKSAFAEGGPRWGLAPEQVLFVCQRDLPVLGPDGRALLTNPGSLATAPDGHGGALGALARSGVLATLVERGVEVLTTFQVDNPLARPLDPVMLGWMVERRAEAVGKAVKRLPGERVGVYARDLEGRHLVVEYSEFPEGGMPDELTMGSIALHAFRLPWLHGLLDGGLSLPFHLAWKRVPSMTTEGQCVDPGEPNAWKFEQFLFDVIPHATRAEVQEVERAREFAPVKNAEGTDSPETARRLVEAEVRRAFVERGRVPPDSPSLRPLEL